MRNKQIGARVSICQYNVLKRVADENGFRSVYDLITYIVLCFLRAIDKNKGNTDTEPESVTATFEQYSNAKAQEWIKPQRRWRRSVNDKA